MYDKKVIETLVELHRKLGEAIVNEPGFQNIDENSGFGLSDIPWMHVKMDEIREDNAREAIEEERRPRPSRTLKRGR
jgi:hypothetical protein